MNTQCIPNKYFSKRGLNISCVGMLLAILSFPKAKLTANFGNAQKPFGLVFLKVFLGGGVSHIVRLSEMEQTHFLSQSILLFGVVDFCCRANFVLSNLFRTKAGHDKHI